MDKPPQQLLDLLDLLGVQTSLWDEGLETACLRAQDRVYALMSSEAPSCVGDLLAVIHGDGGHHLLEHGLERSCLDAEKVVTDLRISVAAWQESYDTLVHSEDPW